MITPEQAASVSRVSLRTIFTWVEGSRIHFTEQSDQSVKICTASLQLLNGAAQSQEINDQ